MKHFILSFLIISATALHSFGWGQKGHDVVAEIATRHLTPAASAAVDSILGGKTPVYWANWMDNASHTPTYAYTKTWHYKNIDAGDTWESSPANPSGDVITALASLTEQLRRPDLKPDESFDALRMVIHLVGDLHCPMHMGHATDRGGNRVKVKCFGRDTNLHSVWDSQIIGRGHDWSYTEWADQLDRLDPEAMKVVTAGDPEAWAREILPIVAHIYESTPEGTSISYDYIAEWAPVAETQLLKGGLRLAALLNSIYGSAE